MMTYPELKIGDLTAKKPIIQGGMGIGISLSGLAGKHGSLPNLSFLDLTITQ